MAAVEIPSYRTPISKPAKYRDLEGLDDLVYGVPTGKGGAAYDYPY